ncbi:MAG TPA: hypothetical protein VE987_02200 [Polyangiaceae bacterium]|nr:hypothetical protein [Polyangiaceae bacterium]
MKRSFILFLMASCSVAAALSCSSNEQGGGDGGAADGTAGGSSGSSGGGASSSGGTQADAGDAGGLFDGGFDAAAVMCRNTADCADSGANAVCCGAAASIASMCQAGPCPVGLLGRGVQLCATSAECTAPAVCVQLVILGTPAPGVMDCEVLDAGHGAGDGGPADGGAPEAGDAGGGEGGADGGPSDAADGG